MSNKSKVGVSNKSKVGVEPPLKATFGGVTFGPIPILPGEDPDEFDALLTEISSAVKPVDAIENILVTDYVDLTWQIFRLRRIKEALLEHALPSALEDMLRPLIHRRKPKNESRTELNLHAPFVAEPPPPAYTLVKKWLAGDAAAKRRVEKLMASRKYSMTTVLARAFIENADLLDCIERMSASLEGRRNAVLREIDRRRAVLAQKLSDVTQKIENAEFESVEVKSSSSSTKKVA
jgi:hypothetical protein